MCIDVQLTCSPDVAQMQLGCTARPWLKSQKKKIDKAVLASDPRAWKVGTDLECTGSSLATQPAQDQPGLETLSNLKYLYTRSNAAMFSTSHRQKQPKSSSVGERVNKSAARLCGGVLFCLEKGGKM